jgi:septum formation inhibitor MinC
MLCPKIGLEIEGEIIKLASTLIKFFEELEKVDELVLIVEKRSLCLMLQAYGQTNRQNTQKNKTQNTKQSKAKQTKPKQTNQTPKSETRKVAHGTYMIQCDLGTIAMFHSFSI